MAKPLRLKIKAKPPAVAGTLPASPVTIPAKVPALVVPPGFDPDAYRLTLLFREWLASTFTVAAGISRGKPFDLHDHQAEFTMAYLRRDGDDPLYRTLSYSLPRKCGKSTFTGALLLGLCLPDSPLFFPNFRGIIIAPTARHSGFIPEAMGQLLETASRDAEMQRVTRPAPGAVKFRTSKAKIQILSGDGKSGHGEDADLAVLDEAGLLPRQKSELVDSARDSLAARNGQMILTGVRADSPKFNEILESKDPKNYVQLYAADNDGDPGDPAQWQKATPGFGVIKSASFIADAYSAAKESGSVAAFQTWHLNLRRSPDRALLLQHHELSACYTDDPKAGPIPGEPCYIGLDLGGSASMTAAVIAYESGFLRLLGAFPGQPMTLLERGRKDFCGDAYVRGAEAGHLITTSGLVSNLDEFLPALVQCVGPHEIKSVSTDRYRQAELLTALARNRLDWKPIFRGTGPKDGDNDVRACRRLFLSRSVRLHRSTLLECSIAEADCRTAATGAVSLDKSHPNARIDVAQALVLACAALLEARERPPVEWEVAIL